MKASQSCLTLCDPMFYTVHRMLRARIPEWVAFPSFRGSSQPRDQTRVSCIAGGFFTSWSHKGNPRILEWVAFPFSRGSSQTRNRTRVSCTAEGFFTNWAIREADYQGTLTVWITANCEKFLRRWKYQTTLPISWETCMQVKKQQLEPDMKQWTGSNLARSTWRLYIVTLLI